MKCWSRVWSCTRPRRVEFRIFAQIHEALLKFLLELASISANPTKHSLNAYFGIFYLSNIAQSYLSIDHDVPESFGAGSLLWHSNMRPLHRLKTSLNLLRRSQYRDARMRMLRPPFWLSVNWTNLQDHGGK